MPRPWVQEVERIAVRNRRPSLRKFDLIAAAIGVAVASLLTWSAYYSNSHGGRGKISESVFLVLFPSSLGLMATENASVLGQVTIVLIVVAVNGVLYGLVSVVWRAIFSK
jgi:hypothetical protein